MKELTADDVCDVSRARAALEAAGVRRWNAASEVERQVVRDALDHYIQLANEASDLAVVTEAHLSIHRTLVGLSGSRRLAAAADALNAEIRLGLAHLDRTRRNLDEQVADHRRLLGLLEVGQVDAAVQELENHLVTAKVTLLAATGHGTIEP
ncbi:MAG: FCD domain-containing protein [Nocardioidaceae bacterium]